MTFGYSYKTSDGVRHQATCEAHAKEEVFAALRERKIRPIRVWPVRRWYHVSKRSAALVVVSALLAVAVVGYFRQAEDAGRRGDAGVAGAASAAAARSRDCIGPLPPGLSACFRHPAEAFLVHFAQPATPIDDAVSRMASSESLAADLAAALDEPIAIDPQDSPAVASVKRIIAGLKNEAKAIVANGRTPQEALRYFVDRQQMEFAHRERVIEQVKDGSLGRDDANALFRTMGFPPLP